MASGLFKKSIDALVTKIGDPVFCQKLKAFCDAPEGLKNEIRTESKTDEMDLIVVILRTELIYPQLNSEQIGRSFNAYVAWNNCCW